MSHPMTTDTYSAAEMREAAAPDVAEHHFRDGDVFFWTFRDGHGQERDTYWCCSRIAVVRNGRLEDTFWIHLYDGKWSGGCEGRRWTPHQAAECLELKFQGNLSDFDRIDPCKIPYYEPADILNMQHSNDSNGPVFLRKGAKRSAAVMLADIAMRVEKQESAIRVAQWSLERLAEEKAKIEAGDVEGVYL